MARKNAGLLELIAELPWQAGVAIAGLAYCALRFGLPLVGTNNPFLNGFVQLGSKLAPLAAGLVLVAALIGFFGQRKRARLLDEQSGISSIRDLSWQEFEQLVGEYYRREGYSVQETGQFGSDGGVDLRLSRDGKCILVQCKRWRTWKVGVGVIRELLGSMASFGASAGVVVTSGVFTIDAQRFARENGITLVNGNQLEKMVSSVRAQSGGRAHLPSPANRVYGVRKGIARTVVSQALVPLVFTTVVIAGMLLMWQVIAGQIRGMANSATTQQTIPVQEVPASLSSRSVSSAVRPLDGRIYRWQDANGEMVYGDRPPANVEAVEMPGRLQDANVIRGY